MYITGLPSIVPKTDDRITTTVGLRTHSSSLPATNGDTWSQIIIIIEYQRFSCENI